MVSFAMVSFAAPIDGIDVVKVGSRVRIETGCKEDSILSSILCESLSVVPLLPSPDCDRGQSRTDNNIRSTLSTKISTFSSCSNGGTTLAMAYVVGVSLV